MKPLFSSFSDYQLVCVIWRDPTTITGWRELYAAQSDQPLLCRAVGWLIEDNPESISLAQLDNDAEQVSEVFTLPKLAILEMWEFRRKGKLI